MSSNFYRGVDAAVVSGSANFAALIASAYGSYGLTSAQAAAFGVLNSALQSAYGIAIEPSTRTRVAIYNKTAALRDMRASAILLSKIIYATPTVSDSQLIGLGLLPRSIRAPILPPASAPVVEVGIVSGRRVNLRLRSADSGRRGMQAKGCNLYSFVGPDAPGDPADWRFEGVATRTIWRLNFPDSVASGATVWLSARWITARAATSPASEPVCFNLQGGAVLPKAA